MPDNVTGGPPGNTSVPLQEPGSEAPWRRVHPISPLVRGWLAVLAVAYVWGQNWLEGLASVDVEVDGGGPDALVFAPGLLWLVLGGLGLLLLVILGFLLSWRFTKYQVTDSHVNVNSGVVFRRQRQARIDRVQAIDIVQPLLARIFNLAELKFEVADAGETAMSLAYLKLDEAKRLRNGILAHAAGLKSAAVPEAPGPTAAKDGPGPTHALHPGSVLPRPAPQDAPEAPEQTVAVVPARRLVVSQLCRPSTVSLVVVLAAGGIASGRWPENFSMFYLVPFFLAFGGSLWGDFNRGFNFRAATSSDGLRLSYGLLDTRHQTVPPGRVQAVQVVRPLLWRPFGWYRVVVNVAGYGKSADGREESRSTLLPVGTFQDVVNVLAIVLPDPGVDRPLDLVAAGIDGSGAAEGFTTSPRRVRPLSPFAWRRQGFALTRTALVARTGVLHRRMVLVPHERTQALVLRQGPLARRFGVCNLHLATTAGPVEPVVVQVSVEDGRALFLEQADRAAAARHLKDRDHWLEEPADGGAMNKGPVPGGPADDTSARPAQEERHG